MNAHQQTAVVLHPKPPFRKWILMNDSPGQAEAVCDALDHCPTIYLVRDCRVLADQLFGMAPWQTLFQSMLTEWTTDQSLWPAHRRRRMFEEWFSVETFSMSEDDYVGQTVASLLDHDEEVGRSNPERAKVLPSLESPARLTERVASAWVAMTTWNLSGC